MAAGGHRTSVAAGLFALPEAANLAAVLFGNSSTVSMHVLHKTPLRTGVLRGVTEHQRLDDGRVLTTTTRLSPFTSQTSIFEGAGAQKHALLQLARFLSTDTSSSAGRL